MKRLFTVTIIALALAFFAAPLVAHNAAAAGKDETYTDTRPGTAMDTSMESHRMEHRKHHGHHHVHHHHKKAHKKHEMKKGEGK